MSMKVLFCTNQFASVKNGPAKFAVLLMELQKQRSAETGVEIRILTEDQTPHPFSDQAVMRVHVPLAGLLPQPLLYLSRAKSYLKEAHRIRKTIFDFDVLVFNNAISALGVRQNRPYRVYGMINDYNNLEPDFFRQYGIKAYSSRLLLRKLEEKAAQKVDVVVANSDFLAAKIVSGYDVPSARVAKFYKAINLDKINYRERTLSAGATVDILYVKTNYQRGGLPVLLQALAQLKVRAFKVTVIGSGAEFLEFYKNNFGAVPSNVQLSLEGRQPQEIVYSAMDQADLFCVPALTEALGVANIEAMAHGLPVVTTDAGGIPEVTREGANAWVAEANSVSSLAATITACLSSPSERLIKARKARNFIEHNFSRESAFSNYIALLKKLPNENY